MFFLCIAKCDQASNGNCDKIEAAIAVFLYSATVVFFSQPVKNLFEVIYLNGQYVHRIFTNTYDYIFSQM